MGCIVHEITLTGVLGMFGSTYGAEGNLVNPVCVVRTVNRYEMR